MKPEIKTKWVEALRSGQYQQGHDRLLNKAGQYCCLGVLCDIVKREVRGFWDDSQKGIQFAFEDNPDECHSGTQLPGFVAEYVGLASDQRDPEVPHPAIPGRVAHLSTLNDGNGNIDSRTFAEIADLIEQHL